MLGSNIGLDSLESQVNEILMRFKVQEFKDGLDTNGDYFGATRHFFHSKPYIEASDVFKIIKMLPKGKIFYHNEFWTGTLNANVNSRCCAAHARLDHGLQRLRRVQSDVLG